MKKLILITGILLSTSLWADMDRICTVVYDVEGKPEEILEQIVEKQCERNNVLEVLIPEYDESTKRTLLLISNYFCRFDRNRDIEKNLLSCILYSPNPRDDS